MGKSLVKQITPRVQHTIHVTIQYIATKSYVHVRVVQRVPLKKPGYQALKNQDFIDHSFWPDSYSYYKQVTKRQIIDKYSSPLHTQGWGEVSVHIDPPIEKKHIIIKQSPSIVKRLDIIDN